MQYFLQFYQGIYDSEHLSVKPEPEKILVKGEIYAVEKLTEEEMRQIDVLIHKQQSFLVVNITNPEGEPLLFEEGLPVTTKADKTIHGFGVRSMKYIVKKYDGFLNASEEDGCFSLKILIPLPN